MISGETLPPLRLWFGPQTKYLSYGCACNLRKTGVHAFGMLCTFSLPLGCSLWSFVCFDSV